MAIADRLRPGFVIERDIKGAVDDENHPAVTPTDMATVDALVQERTGHLVSTGDLRGEVIANALVFLASGTEVTGRDRIRTPAGRRYELLAVRDAGGRSDRGIQADARRIG